LRRLPLAILYLTDRCNSRCVTCDYWRHGRDTMTLESVRRLVPSLEQLGTHSVLFSGGEPLLNPEWPSIARLLRSKGLKLWLLTSGLALSKHAHQIAEYFDNLTVSLDGADAPTYAAIRGVNAFDKVCEGIRKAAAFGVSPSLRITLQRGNFRQMPDFVDLGRALGARSVSFLAVDVANPHAFGRTDDFRRDLALRADDLPVLEALISDLETARAGDFQSGFIAENPGKLRRIHQYFAAVQNQAAYPPVRCNAPEFSAVLGATGQVQPCFFIAGPPHSRLPTAESSAELAETLNSESMSELRAQIRRGERAECKTCVCSMWRAPESFASLMIP
jgi:radical SAM protein with 4Fe4S-binding SPASM domain